MRSRSNLFFAIIAFIAFFIIIFIIIITIRGNNKGVDTGTDQSINDVTAKDFDKEKARNKTLKFSILGGVKANENYRTLEMSVSPYSRAIRVTKTYTNEVEKEANLDNNQAAYDAFFAAVDSEGFFKAKTENKKPDENYACPSEKHYKLEVVDGSEVLYSAWATFCNDSRYGTYNGYVNDTEALFRRQFPDYKKFMSGVRLN